MNKKLKRLNQKNRFLSIFLSRDRFGRNRLCTLYRFEPMRVKKRRETNFEIVGLGRGEERSDE